MAALHLAGAGRLRAQGHDMSMMGMSMGPGPISRTGSGTSWLPDSSPMRMLMTRAGAWTISFHTSAFAQYVDQSTKRGATQLGATDWEMLMATRAAAGGTLQLRAMTSFEPLVLGGRGYPELLQSGGVYQHAPLHDRQHPHEGVMEAAALFDRPLTESLRWSVYAGAVGEPALGPVAFMHRPSAENDPFAPIGHHWQDAAHVSFGMATLGVESKSLRVEASVFNPREATDEHLVVDYTDATLNSYSARVSWMPTPRTVFAAWQAYVGKHEADDPDGRMHRYGASFLYGGTGPGGGRLSSALIWGMNVHDHGPFSHAAAHGGAGASPHHASHSLLAEANLDVGPRTAIFARAERVQKNGEELGFSGGDLTTLYDLRTLAAGASVRLATAKTMDVAAGFRTAVNFVPETLLATYGTRTPTGFAVYLQFRPSRSSGSH